MHSPRYGNDFWRRQEQNKTVRNLVLFCSHPLINRPDTAFWVRGLWNLARCYELEENVEPAENAIQLAISLSENSQSVPISSKFLVHYEAGMLNARFRNGTPAGLKIAKAALAFAKRQPDPMYVFAAYELLADIARRQKDFSQQRKFLKQSLGFLKEQTGLEYLLGDIYVALANSYGTEGSLTEGMANVEKAIAIQTEFDPGYLHYGLTTRAKIHVKAKRYDPALKDLNKSMVLQAGGSCQR